MDTHELSCRIRSVRKKKRLVKTDKDKRLIKLSKKRSELWQQQLAMPMVPLENPYQSGWKRYFVLREDIAHSPRAEFYTLLLHKINTIEYHHDKTYKRKKRRRGRYGYEIKRQWLRELTPYLWNSSKLDLSEQERACFSEVETYDIKTRRQEISYVFTEPWRYRLKVSPHMITHKKLLDSEIVSNLDQIANHIRIRNLQPRINLLTYGRGYNGRNYYFSLVKYGRRKKMPKYRSVEAYLSLDF